MDWSEILQDEREYFRSIGTKLIELQTAASENLAMEEIYAGVWAAYQAGLDALTQFESDMESIQAAINTGQIDNHYVSMFRTSNVPQDRWIAAMHVVACLRCLHRPSQVFRRELQRQSAALIGKLQVAIRDPALDPEGVTQDMHTIGTLLCSFDTSSKESSKMDVAEHWFKGFLKPQVMIGAAAAVAGTYFVLEKTDWIKKRKKPKAIAAPVEEEDEELEFDGAEDLPALETSDIDDNEVEEAV